MVKFEKGPPLGGPKISKAAPSKSGSTLDMASHIKVVVRVRPMCEKEKNQNNRTAVEVVDEQMLVFDPKEEDRPFFYHGVQQPNKNFLKRANKELKFVFDHVYSQDATNYDVFETTTKEMLSSLMEGYNCSVFAYGATGAGKTYTMIGSKEHPGITYLTMEHLFYSINSFEKDREFDIGVSYIEVYNENVYDLLKPSSTPLQLREDSKYGVTVAGLTLFNIKTARELLNMLEDGNKNRTQHPTDANAESSRSHAVFQVYVKMRYKTSSQIRIVKLSMIDLAGSERASATGCIGERFKEGANINKSLLSLGNCINKLADGSAYIPYRDSKLTRLLKDSLGGNCKTIMIANVSPSSLSYEDTYNTLKYAARANKIQLSCKKNIVDGNMKLSQYVKITEELKKKVKELEAKLSLSSVAVVKKHDVAEDKGKQEWRRLIESEENVFGVLEERLLSIMRQQRVLALRQRLRTRAFTHVADLAHRSSCEPINQTCTEDLPRHERAAEHYSKQSALLEATLMKTWTEWDTSRKTLQRLYNEALSEFPDLMDFVDKLQQKSELRHVKARDELRHKLLLIENQEINAFTEYMSEMPAMLKKLYLILKGYDRAPPSLSAEYTEIMKKAKSAKGITWDDEVKESDEDIKFISTMDIEKPSISLDYSNKDDINDAVNNIVTESDDSGDVENRDPIFTLKRKGTPVKLKNNETIIINDSIDSVDMDNQCNSAKKMKKAINSLNTENICIDANNLNSTFVLANKMEPWKKASVKVEPKSTLPVKRELIDRTNIINRGVNINDNKAKIVKPVVGRAIPFRRPVVALPRPVTGFGSSVGRGGTPTTRNIQAVRTRERVQTHPYSRPTAFNMRK
ncbi:kinesin-like protein KIF18A isoform X2 [Leptidea sinapis]|uniref:kinesin-like protein KIF18A isoform X2 n=1 Tax=Leptidea sinapis TaxID=189913 RepID=UPI0021C4A9B1|nr:kinesin-like protein KIF18A isoform X2 [Leptidea sinapis]